MTSNVMQLYSLESQHANEVAELMNQNEVLKIHTQKMIIEHKQQLETQLREQEVSHNHIQYFSNMHLNSFLKRAVEFLYNLSVHRELL